MAVYVRLGNTPPLELFYTFSAWSTYIQLRVSRESERTERDTRVLRRAFVVLRDSSDRSSFHPPPSNFFRPRFRRWMIHTRAAEDAYHRRIIVPFIVVDFLMDLGTCDAVAWQCGEAVYDAVESSALYRHTWHVVWRALLSRERASVRRIVARAERDEAWCGSADVALCDALQDMGVPRVTAQGWISPDPQFE